MANLYPECKVDPVYKCSVRPTYICDDSGNGKLNLCLVLITCIISSVALIKETKSNLIESNSAVPIIKHQANILPGLVNLQDKVISNRSKAI